MLPWQYGFPSCSVSTVRFESAPVRKTNPEAVKPDVGVAVDGFSMSNSGTPIYVRAHNSLPFLLRLRGYGPIHLVKMVVSVRASELLYLA